MTRARARLAVFLTAVLLGLVVVRFDAVLLALGPGPDAPQLLSPDDGTTGVPTTTTLTSYVTDPDGGYLTVTASLRETSGDPFTIIALPDTQFYSKSYPDTYTAQTQWIVDNRDDLNIVFVTHEGDIVDSNTTTQWNRADTSMRLLDVAGIPYGVGPGNHDLPTTMYNQYFGVGRFQGRSYYGGHYQDKNDNNFQLFSASGMDFVIVHLEYCPAAAAVAWASSVYQAYPDRIGILTTHAYLDGSANRKAGGCQAQYLWDDLAVPNPNLRFMLCGHISGESRRTDAVNGRTVHQMLADFQGRSEGGQGFLRILRFVPTEGKVYVQTYSPTKRTYETDSNSQFTLDFPMSAGTGAFQAVGTVNVLEGSDAEIPVGNLDPFTTYQWRVTVTNSHGQSRTGPTWTFTTGEAGSVPNDPPEASSFAVTVPEDTSTFVTLSGSDPDGNPLTYAVVSPPAHGTLTGTLPNLTYTPSADYFGSDSFTYRAHDGQAQSPVATVSITVQPVNDAPVAGDDSFSIQAGATLTVSAPGVMANDVDRESSPLSAALDAPPAHGALTLDGSGSFTYTPAAGYAGPDAFTYTVSDGLTSSAAATVTVTVTPPPGAGDLKVITFEGGALEDPVTGADDVKGSVTLETAAPLKGSYAARVNGKTAYLIAAIPSTPDVYVTFVLRLNATPSSDVYLLRILNGSSTVGTIQIRSSRKVRLRNNSSTIGSETAALTLGRVYRLGIHQRARTGGSNNGVLEAFLAEGDEPFGSPFAALATGSWTSGATEVRVGTITSVQADLALDDIKIDSHAMPGAVPDPPPPGSQVPPDPPSGLQASPGSSAVALTWTDASANEAAFLLERAGSDLNFVQIASLTANTTAYTDTAVTPETEYHYRVRATNSAGESAYSDPVTTTTLPPSAALPIKLMTFESGTITDAATGADSVSGTVSFETASPIKGSRSASFAGSAYIQEDFPSTDDFTLTFYLRLPSQAPSNVRMALISNSGTTVGNLYLLSTRQLRLRNNSTSIASDSPALTPGVAYRVQVHQQSSSHLLEAFLAVGDAPFGAPFASGTSSWSGSANRIRIGGTNGSFYGVLDDVSLEEGGAPVVVTLDQPPAAPADLTATAAADAVALSWTDASSDETGFLLERAASDGGFEQVATIAADSTSYMDLSLAPQTDYSYRLAAVNDAGVSDFTAPVMVTTQAANDTDPGGVPEPGGEPDPEEGAEDDVIKAMTFESGGITDPVTGAGSMRGTIDFEVDAPLVGTRSVAVTGSSYLQEDFAATDDFTLTFYLQLPSVPATDVRIALISNSGTTVGNLYVRADGRLRLRKGSTTVGSESSPLAPGSVYRVLVRQHSSAHVLEAFVANGDEPFGAPFASSTGLSWSGQATRIRIGGTNGDLDGVIDEVILYKSFVLPSPF